MKINKNTKMALGGIAVLGVAYMILKPKDDDRMFGGGGGAPLLPALEPESTPAGDIIYNLGGATPDWGEDAAIWGDDGTKKGTFVPSFTPTKPLEYYASGGVSELSSYATPEQKLKSVMELQHYGDPLAYAFSGRTDRITSKKQESTLPESEGVAWYKPWDWNLSDASVNYQEWVDASNERFWGNLSISTDPTTTIKTKKVREAAIDRSNVQNVVNAVQTKKTAANKRMTKGEYEGRNTGVSWAHYSATGKSWSSMTHAQRANVRAVTKKESND